MSPAGFAENIRPLCCIFGKKDVITLNYRFSHKRWMRYADEVQMREIAQAGHYFMKSYDSQLPAFWLVIYKTRGEISKMDALTRPSFIIINLSLLFLIFSFRHRCPYEKERSDPSGLSFLMTTIFLWGVGSVLLYYDYLTGSPVRFFTVCLAYIGLILTPIAVLPSVWFSPKPKSN